MTDPLQEVSFIIYDATGRILRSGSCQFRDIMFQQCPPGATRFVTSTKIDLEGSYVDVGVDISDDEAIKPRTPLEPSIVGLTPTGTVFSGLPKKSRITIDHRDVFDLVGNETSIQFTFPQGIYDVRIDSVQCLPYVGELDIQ